MQGTPLPPPAFAFSELRLGMPSLRAGCRAEASAKADRQSQKTLTCDFSKKFVPTSLAAARCFDCSRAVGVVLTATWSLVRSHSNLRPLPVRTGGGFRFFRVSGRLARLAGEQRLRHRAKERPPRGGLSEIGSGVLIGRLRVRRSSPASCAGAREKGREKGQEKGPSMTPGPFIAILEVASSGPSAVPQSGTNQEARTNQINWSAGAKRQAAAGRECVVRRLLPHRTRRSLQRLVGDFEGKDFFSLFNSHRGFGHGFDPFLGKQRCLSDQ